MEKTLPHFTHVLSLKGEAATAACAHALARELQGGECVLLCGTLGAGKTTFARAVVRALCGETTEVVSPTFMLVQEYAAQNRQRAFPLLHFDLYRLKHAEELMELGMEEALGHALLLVEWPEIAEGYWPDDRLEIHIDHDPQDNAARRLQVIAQGAMVAPTQRFIARWEPQA